MKLNVQTALIWTFTFLFTSLGVVAGETSKPIFSSGTDFMAPKRVVDGKSLSYGV